MTLKSRLDSNQGATILLVGDSLTGEEYWKYPRKIADALCLLYPTANVAMQLRSVNQSEPLPLDSVLQTGPGQTIRVLIDGVPGNKTIDCINRMQNLYRETPVHLVSFSLGINDCIHAYPPTDMVSNLVYLCNYAKQVHGAEVSVVTPTWSEQVLSAAVGGYADCARIAAAKVCANLVDTRLDYGCNYQPGNGLFGQGIRFSNQNDCTHPNATGHLAIAQVWLAAHGF